MLFLRGKVQNEERILLARSGFSEQSKRSNREEKSEIATAADLFVGSSEEKMDRNCIFCGKSSHFSSRYLIAKKMSIGERQKVVEERKTCYTCLSKELSAKIEIELS